MDTMLTHPWRWNGSSGFVLSEPVSPKAWWGSSTGAYTTLTPRHAVTAVPYALYALATPWSGLTDVPPDFGDGVDDNTLGGLSCSNGQVARWNGTAWTCGADDDTIYTAGTGLTLSGNQFSRLCRPLRRIRRNQCNLWLLHAGQDLRWQWIR